MKLSIRFSDAIASAISDSDGLRKILHGSNITLFTGSQPTSANDSSGSSQPIISFTLDDGVYIPETRATWGFELSAMTGTAGVSSLSVNGYQLLTKTIEDTDLATVIQNIVTDINDNVKSLGYSASSSSSQVTIKAPRATGSLMNGFSLAVVTTGSITSAYLDSPLYNGSPTLSGVNSSNGLSFSSPVDGSTLSPQESVFYISKTASETWKGKNGFGPASSVASTVYSGIETGKTYSAGWGRICVDSGDTGLGSTFGQDGYARVDFSVGVSSSDCIILPNTSFLINTTSGSEIESIINSFVLKLKKNMS